MRVPFFKCAARRLLDSGRGIKIRLSHLQVDDVDAVPFQFMGPLEHIHYDERRNLPGSF